MASLPRQLARIRTLRDRMAWLHMERQKVEEGFVKEFRAWRLANNIALREAAEQLDISASYLSDIELGKRGLSPEMIIKLKAFLSEHKQEWV